jgi:K(+)-stimulated pyrophosphate-energized sodium pump
MAADVFETYAISIIGTILVGFLTLAETPQAVIYPFLLAGISVLSAIVGIYYVNKRHTDPARLLTQGVVVSSLISAVLYWPATQALFPASFKIGAETHTPFQVYLATLIGLALTGVIVAITNSAELLGCQLVRRGGCGDQHAFHGGNYYLIGFIRTNR